jgi:signal transduction histidine kinase
LTVLLHRKRAATVSALLDWLNQHKQRLAYALLAVAMVAALAAAAGGGFFLRHAANIERQALRTQQLAGAVAQLQRYLLQAQAEGMTKQLVASRKLSLAASDAAFASVRAHDRAEGDRIRDAYVAYVLNSTEDFNRVRVHGTTTAAEQRKVDRRLNRVESLIDVESHRLARETRVANPRARAALATALVAAALLVGLLIWQFELQRRAGRIDRDHAARSEELMRLKDEFVASVSHELRTPLTSIIGYLDLLDEDEAANMTPEQHTFLSVVHRSAHRLRELVGDLLLVAEAEGGMLALDLHDVDLGALAADCVEAARPTADAKQIQLSLDRDGLRQIQGDPTRLAQMMDNLVSNAIKFTPAGGRVAVRTAFENGQALFEVADTGYGISSDDQAHLFDRFFRAPTAFTQAVRGTGLGLTITKSVVDAHHGSISVESTLGERSIFLVRLPVTQESLMVARV